MCIETLIQKEIVTDKEIYTYINQVFFKCIKVLVKTFVLTLSGTQKGRTFVQISNIHFLTEASEAADKSTSINISDRSKRNQKSKKLATPLLCNIYSCVDLREVFQRGRLHCRRVHGNQQKMDLPYK